MVHLAANVGGLFKNMHNKVRTIAALLRAPLPLLGADRRSCLQVAMFHDNVLMNENVLHFADKHGVPFGIFFASTCVFPDQPRSFPMTEDMLLEGHPHHSNNSYAYAKRMMAFQCGNYNRERGRKYFVVSPTNLFGKYDNFNLQASRDAPPPAAWESAAMFGQTARSSLRPLQDAHVIPALIHKFKLAEEKGNELVIPTGSNSLRQFVYSKDLAQVVLDLIKRRESLTVDSLICAGENELRIVDVIHKIAAHFPNAKYRIEEKEEGQVRKTCSIERFRQVLPEFQFTGFDKCLDRTIKWFKANYPDHIRK